MTKGALTTSSAADFPTANLGPSALAWARAVMQRIAQLEDAAAADASKILALNKTLIQVLRLAGMPGGADPSVYTHSRILTQGASGTTYDNTDASSNFFGIENNTNPTAYAVATFWGPASIESQVMDLQGGRMTDVQQEFGFWQLNITDSANVNHELIYADATTLRLMGQAYTPGSVGASLPATAANGQVLTWNGTAWAAEDLPADNDPSDLPASAATGQVLTWNGTGWVAQTPASSGGSSGGSGTAAAMSTTTPSTASTTGWVQNAAYGTLTSDGTVLVLTSTAAAQFVRYYFSTTPIPAPINLATTEITFDIFIPTANAAGMSAGIDLSVGGAPGYFNVRVDVGTDGVTCGLRFEQDGQANIASLASVPQLTVGAWHTIRFVRHGASAIAFVDGVRVLGTDGGPTTIANQITLLLYGGSASGAVAKYRNIVVKTYGDPEAAVTAIAPQAVFTFATAAAQWTINHGFGRIPAVTTYDAAGAHNLAEFTATSTQVVVTWANPTAGTAVLS